MVVLEVDSGVLAEYVLVVVELDLAVQAENTPFSNLVLLVSIVGLRLYLNPSLSLCSPQEGLT